MSWKILWAYFKAPPLCFLMSVLHRVNMFRGWVMRDQVTVFGATARMLYAKIDNIAIMVSAHLKHESGVIKLF